MLVSIGAVIDGGHVKLGVGFAAFSAKPPRNADGAGPVLNREPEFRRISRETPG